MTCWTRTATGAPSVGDLTCQRTPGKRPRLRRQVWEVLDDHTGTLVVPRCRADAPALVRADQHQRLLASSAEAEAVLTAFLGVAAEVLGDVSEDLGAAT